MDFWRSLLGGTSRTKAAVNDPQQRLARFKQRYNHILQTWQKTHTLASDREALGHIRRSLQALAAILNDESRSPAPHLCLAFAAHQQIYTAVSKIAATSHDEGMVRDAVTVYSALIDSEEEDFLENDVFAASLMNFIGRTIGSGSMGVGEDIEADMVELLFGIAAKIRLQPEILPVWFTTAAADHHGRLINQKTDFAGVTQKEDFPLCYQLIDHVHHEGRIGDFARTGLLYIFESASKSTTLEQWIVNSDLPTLMASGLGALYSQLSRKLSILHEDNGEGLPLILKLSDYAEMQPNPDAESFFSEHFRRHMETFLSYLRFWQDVLVHCTSADVRLTLIDHFQILFLQQLLYPSLLESSDVDGGSSVAVLTYLRRILDILDHQELVHMILNYLLALPEYDGTSPRTPRTPAAVKRRESLMMLNIPEADDDKMNPTLFNLVDLILSSSESRDSQTVVAALKLATVILSKSHSYAIGSIVRTMSVHSKELHRTVGALNVELETYLNLAIGIAGETGTDEAYESLLKDKLSMLENHPCSLRNLAIPSLSSQTPGFPDSGPGHVGSHYLMPEDPLFRSLLDSLIMFLTNDIETNLALTETINTLSSCSQLRLEGWLSVDPTEYQFPSDPPGTPGNGEEETESTTQETQQEMLRAARRPTWTASAAPQLLKCLQSLHSQIEALRADIQDWDDFVTSRKHIFRTYEEMSDVSKTPATAIKPIPTDQTSTGSWTPQIPGYTTKDASASPSRTASPRGRKEALFEGRQTPAASPAPSKLAGQTLVGSPSRGMSPLPAPRATHSGSMSTGAGTGVGTKRSTTFMADVLANLADVNNSPNLRRRIRFRRPAGGDEVEVCLSKYQPPPPDEDEDAEGANGGQDGNGNGSSKGGDEFREASLGHIITNVVVLQEFVLELVAVMQVRAGLFGEVRHS